MQIFKKEIEEMFRGEADKSDILLFENLLREMLGDYAVPCTRENIRAMLVGIKLFMRACDPGKQMVVGSQVISVLMLQRLLANLEAKMSAFKSP